jgi:hypothetical protein
MRWPDGARRGQVGLETDHTGITLVIPGRVISGTADAGQMRFYMRVQGAVRNGKFALRPLSGARILDAVKD